MKLDLYRQPSLVQADSVEEVKSIIISKAKAFDFKQDKLLDYIGRGLNYIQAKENDLLQEKTEVDLRLKEIKEQKESIRQFIAEALIELGIDKLSDKSATICSSITIQDEVIESIEPKERAMTDTEMKIKLEALGHSTKIIENVKINFIPKRIKVNFKKGMKKEVLKAKDIVLAIEQSQNENNS
jgi:hypothetical protein